MCGHILKKGFRTIVYNRTPVKAKPLLEAGAQWANSPDEVARQAEVIFTMVGFPEDVREVYFGERGILKGVRAGSILVDMTTTEPALAANIYKSARDCGVYALDAPVSGGDIGARNASLSIMIGGDREAVDAIRPLLECMGKGIVHQGGAGAGQHSKLCNQIVIAGTMIGICESLLYGFKAGLNLEEMLRSIKDGAAACWSLHNLAPRILKRDFNPGFFVDHFIKDMGIALKEAAAMQLVLPGLALVHQLYLAVQAQGHGKSGTQALILALENMCRTEVINEARGA
jgi:3-hydroxyisobutyrate dehydrogenase